MSSYLERGNETSIIVVVEIIRVEGRKGGIDESAKPFLRREGEGEGRMGQKEYSFHERIEW